MGFDDGEVILNNPNHAYYTGQEITGVLKFNQDKLKTFRGLYVTLKGRCKVLWTTTTGSGNNRRRVTHENYEEYIDNKIYLVGAATGECTIGIGTHEYPFSFQLPHDCPSSFEGAHGNIRYYLKFIVDRCLRPDQEKKIILHVESPVDLNLDPYSRHPIDLEISASYCCWCINSGGCELQFRAPHSGFCPEQTIPLDISLKSYGSTSINEIVIKIKEKTTFIAKDSRTRSDEKTIKRVNKGPIESNTNRNWKILVDVPVPNIVVRNFIKCGPIEVQYTLKVMVVPSGLHWNDSKTWPIIIGTLPLLPMDGNMPNPIVQTNQAQMQFVPLSNHGNSPVPYSYPAQGYAPYPTTDSPYPDNNSSQPDSSASYPCPDTPKPGINLPQLNSNCPYPSPNPPYPQTNSNPPYPSNALPLLGLSSPYPFNNLTQPDPSPPYLSANAPKSDPNPPYPGHISHAPGSITPYPVTNSPQPGTNPYPSAPNSEPEPSISNVLPNPPYPIDAKPQMGVYDSGSNISYGISPSFGLKTGRIGFIGHDSAQMPLLPPVAMPGVLHQSPNPFADASAPEPGTPKQESNEDPMQKETLVDAEHNKKE